MREKKFMFKRIKSGNSLAQYGIAIALVALLALPALMIFGDQIKVALNNFLQSLTQINIGMDENYNLSHLDSLKAGDLGGTPAEPVEKCSAGKCTIDYGTIILHGIPQNYSDVVDASGASGGTKINLALLEQVAKQLEPANQLEADKIRELIALGNDIIKVEDRFEANKDAFASNLNQYQTFLNALHQATNANEINTLVANNQALINSTQNLFHNPDEMQFEGSKTLGIDMFNVANALHPEGAVFWSEGQGSCYANAICSDLDPDGHYNRNISGTSSFEDYINGTTSITPINNNAPYPPNVNPSWMVSSSNTPTGNYFIKLKSLVNSGALDGNPAAKELVQSLSKEIYGMTNELIAITHNMDTVAPPPHGSYGNSTYLGDEHDMFGIQYAISNGGQMPTGYKSAVEIYKEGVEALSANPRDALNKTLICTPARVNNPKYADKCN